MRDGPDVTILTDQPIECPAHSGALGLVVVVGLVNDACHGLGAHGDPDQDGHVVQEALEWNVENSSILLNNYLSVLLGAIKRIDPDCEIAHASPLPLGRTGKLQSGLVHISVT